MQVTGCWEISTEPPVRESIRHQALTSAELYQETSLIWIQPPPGTAGAEKESWIKMKVGPVFINRPDFLQERNLFSSQRFYFLSGWEHFLQERDLFSSQRLQFFLSGWEHFLSGKLLFITEASSFIAGPDPGKCFPLSELIYNRNHGLLRWRIKKWQNTRLKTIKIC